MAIGLSERRMILFLFSSPQDAIVIKAGIQQPCLVDITGDDFRHGIGSLNTDSAHC